MLILALPILVGVLLGVLIGGNLRPWHAIQFKYLFPAFVALALQLLIFDPPLERMGPIITYGPMLYLASIVVILFVIVQNARAQPSLRFSLSLGAAALGVALNCAVVAANGGYMPRGAVTDRPPLQTPAIAGRLVNLTPMTPETPLAWLGDVLEEPAWLPLSNVLSIGDVLLAAGLGSWVFAVTLGGVQPRWRQVPLEVEEPCPDRSMRT
jgi:hypothetical protein